MPLPAIDFGAPQFYRSTAAPTIAQKNLAQQSKDLSDAVNALQSPLVAPTSVRASTGTQMATLCLVQPGDSSAGTSGTSLSDVVSAYATVLGD
jgi:hypothetical protein